RRADCGHVQAAAWMPRSARKRPAVGPRRAYGAPIGFPARILGTARRPRLGPVRPAGGNAGWPDSCSVAVPDHAQQPAAPGGVVAAPHCVVAVAPVLQPGFQAPAAGQRPGPPAGRGPRSKPESSPAASVFAREGLRALVVTGAAKALMSRTRAR